MAEPEVRKDVHFLRKLSFPEYQEGKFEYAVMRDTGATNSLMGYFPSETLAEEVKRALNLAAA